MRAPKSDDTETSSSKKLQRLNFRAQHERAHDSRERGRWEAGIFLDPHTSTSNSSLILGPGDLKLLDHSKRANNPQPPPNSGAFHRQFRAPGRRRPQTVPQGMASSVSRFRCSPLHCLCKPDSMLIDDRHRVEPEVDANVDDISNQPETTFSPEGHRTTASVFSMHGEQLQQVSDISSWHDTAQVQRDHQKWRLDPRLETVPHDLEVKHEGSDQDGLWPSTASEPSPGINASLSNSKPGRQVPEEKVSCGEIIAAASDRNRPLSIDTVKSDTTDVSPSDHSDTPQIGVASPVGTFPPDTADREQTPTESDAEQEAHVAKVAAPYLT